VSVQIRTDFSEVDRELRRLGDGPDTRTDLLFDAALTAIFQETQRVVHVITGSLKGSGLPDSDRGRDTWTGEISYGGASPGRVHDPVRYAQFERDRGGWHDFMAPVQHTDHAYIEAMLSFLRGTT
jgi:hypothetical protein